MTSSSLEQAIPPQTVSSVVTTNVTSIPITYRSIQKGDREIIQQLHEEFFPVKYSKAFYDDVVQQKGIQGLPLYSILAINEHQEVIGFILAQMFDYPTRAEDIDLFAFPQQPKQVFYILTLGLKEEYRRHGIASNMIKMCVNYASSHPTCGAVYLHVIQYNQAAMTLYKKNNFQYLRTLPEFYIINQEYFTAYLYIYYVNGHHAPYLFSWYDAISGVGEYVARVLWSLLPSALVNSSSHAAAIASSSSGDAKVRPTLQEVVVDDKLDL